MRALEDALEDGDASRGARKLAEIGAGATHGINPDDVVQALPELDGVGVEWTPKDSLDSARMYHDGEAYVLDEWPLPLTDDWAADALSRHEAAALLEDGFRIRPVATRAVRTAVNSDGGED